MTSASTPIGPGPTGAAVPGVAFYAVADRRHFLGAVALLNSLRLVGHDEPVFLVDAGLTDAQRAAMAPHLTLLPAPPGVPPVYLAPVGPTLRPAEVAVIIDADIIVLRRLDDLISSARAGRLVGFVNDPPNDTRFVPEWFGLLELDGTPRRRAYLNAGLFVVPRTLDDRVLRPWLQAQEIIDHGRTRYGGARMSDPFYFADQDVVNAVLAVALDDDEFDAREHALAPHVPMRGIRILDAATLRCRSADGAVPYLLHHTMTKPWLAGTVPNAYSRLLPRVLLAPDVALRLAAADLPLRLRPGPLGRAVAGLTGTRVAARSAARRQLGRFGLRTRLADARAARQVARGDDRPDA